MQLPEFHYPMFVTTPEEKELLRQCEMHFIERRDQCALCDVLTTVTDFGTSHAVYTSLRIKISNAVGGIFTCLDTHSQMLLRINITTDYDEWLYARNLLRRIWITKLLNYK